MDFSIGFPFFTIGCYRPFFNLIIPIVVFVLLKHVIFFIIRVFFSLFMLVVFLLLRAATTRIIIIIIITLVTLTIFLAFVGCNPLESCHNTYSRGHHIGSHSWLSISEPIQLLLMFNKMWTIRLPVPLLMTIKTLVGVAISLGSASSWRCLGVVSVHQDFGIFIHVMVDRSSGTSSVGVSIFPLVILVFVGKITFPSKIIFVVVIGPIVWPFISAIFIVPVGSSRLPPPAGNRLPLMGSFISSKFYPWFKPNFSFIHFSPRSYCSLPLIGLGLYLIFPIFSIPGSLRFMPFGDIFTCVVD